MTVTATTVYVMRGTVAGGEVDGSSNTAEMSA